MPKASQTSAKEKKQKRRSAAESLLTEDQPENLNEDVRFTQNVVKKGLRNVASHHIESFDYAM